MTFTFLGTGTSQGIPVIACKCEVCTSTDSKDNRLRVSGLIEVDNQTIVIDCGPDFRQQMLSAGVEDIQALLITHEHNDHVIGLDDIRPINFKQRRDMPVFAAKRVGNELKKRFSYVFAENKYPGAPMISLEQIEPNQSFFVNNTEITPISILHGTLPIYGFKIGKLAYLTDVYTIPESEFPKLEDLDVLILSALHHREHHTHITLKQAISLAEKIGAKQTYFTHFSHRMGKHEEVEATLPKNMFFGYDGLKISI